MKLISLNIWGGKVYEPLMSFIGREAETTDIFCFQEVFHTTTEKTEFNGYRLNMFSELTSKLSEFNAFLAPAQDKFMLPQNFVDFDLSFGLAIFVRKNLKASVDNMFVYGKRNSMVQGQPETFPRNIQHISLKASGKVLTVFNYHGLWKLGNKSDTPERLAVSEVIKTHMDSHKGGKIICGDFNLLPDTKSVAILEVNMLNLIKKFGIQSTRSRLYTKDSLKFADYMIASKGIKIKSFEVPNITVSDHLPMVLEFDL